MQTLARELGTSRFTLHRWVGSRDLLLGEVLWSLAEKVRGGDRLPWVKTHANGVDADNFQPLTSIDWQVHVYGDASLKLRTMCDARKLPLHVFPWSPEMGRVGVCRDATCLVRPDGYVAVAAPESSATMIASFLDSREITPPK